MPPKGTQRRTLACVLWLGVFSASVVVAGSCGGGSSPSPSSPSPTPPAASVRYVSVTGNFSLGAVGNTTQLRANGNTASGSQDVTGQATWHSSNDSIATVSSGGLVTATGTGLVVVTATYQNLSGWAGVSVATQVDVSGIWRGTTSNPTSTLTMWLTQAGNGVTGDSEAQADGAIYRGTLTGTVNGGTLVLAGSNRSPSGSVFASWTDERCAFGNANSMKCLNPMTDASGNFLLNEVNVKR